mmetsp:Transcript_32991/g.71881  ORF Transcript_32991/g.71881 Transcript_32991/m.71881 type:complete len:91 (+) Transcript_32991:316-588(+)
MVLLPSAFLWVWATPVPLKLRVRLLLDGLFWSINVRFAPSLRLIRRWLWGHCGQAACQSGFTWAGPVGVISLDLGLAFFVAGRALGMERP